MDSIKYKVNHLNQFMEELDINVDSKEGKLFTEILKVLNSLAEEIESLQCAKNDTEEYIESIEEDLINVKDYIYGYDDSLDFEDEDLNEEEDYVEINCEGCNEVIYVEKDLYNSREDIICPNCQSYIITKNIKE